MNELAVIILNYNDYQMTIKCVTNLVKIHLYADVVVVDNNSSNNSYKILLEKFRRYENISIIKAEKNGGYSFGNNYGIEYALKMNSSVKYIAIMNPDVIVRSEKTFERLTNILEKNSDMVAVTTLMKQEEKIDKSLSGWKLPSTCRIIGSNLLLSGKITKYLSSKDTYVEDKNLRYVQAIHGSFFVIKCGFFKSINLFDSGVFLYYEENILGKKVEKSGGKMAIYLEDYYFHNHVYKKMTLKQVQCTAINMRNSQQYYLLNYVTKSRIIRVIARGTYNIYIYIEIPIVRIVKLFMKALEEVHNGK